MDFKKVKVTLADAKSAVDIDRSAEDTFFKVGLYDVEIIEVQEGRFPPKDPTWKSLNLKVQGSGSKWAFFSPQYPTESTKYKVDGKVSVKPTLNFFNFVKGIGMKEEDDLGQFITKNLEEPSKLVGKKFRAKFDYPEYKVSAKYIEQNTFHAVKYGKPLSDKNGKELVFPSREAVQLYCEQNQLSVAKFVEIVEIIEPLKSEAKQATEVKKAVKKPIVEEDDSDMPF